MVKSAKRHCNDAQSTKLPQCGYSTFWRTTRSYELSVRLAVARCCSIAQYNWFSRFLCQRLDAACSVVPADKLPRNRCSRSRTDGTRQVRIAKALLHLAENVYRQIPQQFHGYQHQSLTKSIVCLL